MYLAFSCPSLIIEVHDIHAALLLSIIQALDLREVTAPYHTPPLRKASQLTK